MAERGLLDPRAVDRLVPPVEEARGRRAYRGSLDPSGTTAPTERPVTRA